MSDVVTGQELATTSGETGTELSTLLEDLSTSQQLAMKALAEGKKYVAAAEAAGVTRATLWRWINHDPQFAAAFEAWQQELRGSARTCLLKVVDNAADVVAQAIACGDSRLALRILQELGVLRDPTPVAPQKKPESRTAVAPAPAPEPVQPSVDQPHS